MLSNWPWQIVVCIAASDWRTQDKIAVYIAAVAKMKASVAHKVHHRRGDSTRQQLNRGNAHGASAWISSSIEAWPVANRWSITSRGKMNELRRPSRSITNSLSAASKVLPVIFAMVWPASIKAELLYDIACRAA